MTKLQEDVAEIATMEKKMTEIEENNRRLIEQIESLSQTLQEQEGKIIIVNFLDPTIANKLSHTGERNAKYEELLKRDQDMQIFLEVFDSKKQEILNTKTTLEDYINHLNVGNFIIIVVFYYSN